MSIINLYDETINILESNNKTWDDIQYICLENYNISIDNFKQIAQVTNYDNGYGIEHIPLSLHLVGEDFWLERREYDGREWWVFVKKPKMGDKSYTLSSQADLESFLNDDYN